MLRRSCSFITTGGFAAVMELFCSTSKRVGGRGDAAGHEAEEEAEDPGDGEVAEVVKVRGKGARREALVTWVHRKADGAEWPAEWVRWGNLGTEWRREAAARLVGGKAGGGVRRRESREEAIVRRAKEEAERRRRAREEELREAERGARAEKRRAAREAEGAAAPPARGEGGGGGRGEKRARGRNEAGGAGEEAGGPRTRALRRRVEESVRRSDRVAARA